MAALTNSDIVRRRIELDRIPTRIQEALVEQHGHGWYDRVLHAAPKDYDEFMRALSKAPRQPFTGQRGR